jgi:hypothetical protein
MNEELCGSRAGGNVANVPSMQGMFVVQKRKMRQRTVKLVWIQRMEQVLGLEYMWYIAYLITVCRPRWLAVKWYKIFIHHIPKRLVEIQYMGSNSK